MTAVILRRPGVAAKAWLRRPSAPSDPTNTAYGEFGKAYDFFNSELFGGQLPRCLITLPRRANSYGYFSAKRFGDRNRHDEITDELALNPVNFATMTIPAILAVLVHEMVHLWQHHFGSPGKRGYHNAEWAARMEDLGLMPSSTGEYGGKRIGQRMHHYIIAGGPFAAAAEAFVAHGGDVRYVDLWDEGLRARKAASKSKFTCPICGQNVWGAPSVHVRCDDCDQPMPLAA